MSRLRIFTIGYEATTVGEFVAALQGAGFDLDVCTTDSDSEGFLEREDGRGLFGIANSG